MFDTRKRSLKMINHIL